jgi:hypothetical protein
VYTHAVCCFSFTLSRHIRCPTQAGRGTCRKAKSLTRGWTSHLYCRSQTQTKRACLLHPSHPPNDGCAAPVRLGGWRTCVCPCLCDGCVCACALSLRCIDLQVGQRVPDQQWDNWNVYAGAQKFEGSGGPCLKSLEAQLWVLCVLCIRVGVYESGSFCAFSKRPVCVFVCVCVCV